MVSKRTGNASSCSHLRKNSNAAKLEEMGKARRAAERRKDAFYRMAKEQGYRSRAAFKLLQINSKFNVIKKGYAVVDLGAAPGGWLQVAKEISGGVVIGVDLQPIAKIEGVETLRYDITSEDAFEKIKEVLRKFSCEHVDVVLSDASPNISGIWSYDHFRSYELCEAALKIATKLLRSGGNFVTKMFQGEAYRDFYEEVRRNFAFTKAYSPQASRKHSAEIYIIGKGFKLK
ncbi:MAG: 23S rRNA U2552 -methylase RlmE/FtsJ [Candidatus Alkanophagales archaeon MCA70_species_2]|nr:23S rRNA U2552 -methylase RlmE/FtsJ [Candidatus Alkanophaga liquidiphilum]